ncbi:hypothetical protein BDV96DRAFT_647475 [Lophiotrema nucula]|uniref:Uncharacterized protein n=1 Tax=Lophiotrema nucula TaxID=690887 RepID=A0A6A5Z4P0_9PLEO|nr:hypothetical protein BDV96DRAFT_647475 [Lophiotrema nucula]
MSAPFLEETKTLTTYRHRLIELALPILGLFKIRVMGRTTTRLRCSLNGEDAAALPDTGSDIDVMSKRYATNRGFLIQSDDTWIMLADQSMQKTVGYCHVQLAVGFGASLMPSIIDTPDVENNRDAVGPAEPIEDSVPSTVEAAEPEENNRKLIRSKFYVVEDLVTDVVIGVSSLESLKVYEEHLDDLVVYDRPTADLQLLNRIHLMPTINELWRGNPVVNGPSIRDMTTAEWLSEVDQEENARREEVRQRIAELGEEEREAATRDENHRQAGFDGYRSSLLRAIRAESSLT